MLILDINMPSKGYKQTDEHRKNIANSKKGISKIYRSEETRLRSISKLKIGPWKGKSRPEITGEKHYLWKGGKCRTERHSLMQKAEYTSWRRSVFERDLFTCQHCKVKGGRLEADHIKPWASFPLLRYEISNGRTLCVSCHRKTPTWGRKRA